MQKESWWSYCAKMSPLKSTSVVVWCWCWCLALLIILCIWTSAGWHWVDTWFQWHQGHLAVAPCICHPRKIMKLSVCGGGVSIPGKGFTMYILFYTQSCQTGKFSLVVPWQHTWRHNAPVVIPECQQFRKSWSKINVWASSYTSRPSVFPSLEKSKKSLCLGFVHTLELMHHQSAAAHVVKGHRLSLSSNWDRPCTFKGAKLIFIFGASVCGASWDSRIAK